MSIASTEPNERKDESPVISINIFKVNQLIDKHRIAWIHSGTKPNEKNKNKQINKTKRDRIGNRNELLNFLMFHAGHEEVPKWNPVAVC